MRLFLPLVGLGVFLSAFFSRASAIAQTPNTFCRAELAPKIAAITHQPEFRRAHWGILIQTLSNAPQTLYAQDANNFFVPASNTKLLTTAAALTQLGPNFRIRTSVYQIPTSDQQVNLQVIGRGDPSFTDAQLQALAKQIHDSGITHIHQLIADDSYFQGDPVNSNWEWEDIQSGYGAPVNSLILNQNAINLTLVPQALNQPLKVEWDDPAVASQWQIVNYSRTVAASASEFVEVGRALGEPILHVQGQLRAGSAPEPVAVSIPQPTQHFLDRLQQILMAQQIRVDQTTIASSPLPETSQEVAAIESPPLSTLLIETNQQSNNLYAEALLRQLGLDQPTEHSSLAAGIKALQTTLAKIGIDSTSYVLTDGSGLSRHNLVSPIALVQTLQAMAQSPYAVVFRNSLSVAGTSGTLRTRFQNTPVQNHFQGKTGTLSDTAALSGYLQLTNTNQLVVSVLVNQTEQPLDAVQAAIDAIIQLLVENC